MRDRLLASGVLLLAALSLVSCEETDPEMLRACEEVRALEDEVLALASTEPGDTDELASRVGAVLAQARQVREFATDTGDEQLISLAEETAGPVATRAATTALETQDPRAAAAPVAQKVVEMRGVCRDSDAYPD